VIEETIQSFVANGFKQHIAFAIVELIELGIVKNLFIKF